MGICSQHFIEPRLRHHGKMHIECIDHKCAHLFMQIRIHQPSSEHEVLHYMCTIIDIESVNWIVHVRSISSAIARIGEWRTGHMHTTDTDTDSHGSCRDVI